jgi:hypothetical protein
MHRYENQNIVEQGAEPQGREQVYNTISQQIFGLLCPKNSLDVTYKQEKRGDGSESIETRTFYLNLSRCF